MCNNVDHSSRPSVEGTGDALGGVGAAQADEAPDTHEAGGWMVCADTAGGFVCYDAMR